MQVPIRSLSLAIFLRMHLILLKTSGYLGYIYTLNGTKVKIFASSDTFRKNRELKMW
jgi:hypothetical protein